MSVCPGSKLIAPMEDGGLARLRIVGGLLSEARCLAIASIAQKFGNGLIDITNRANLQLRGLESGTLADYYQALANANLMPRNEHRDRIRNILIDPFSGLDDKEVIDCSNLALSIEQLIEDDDSLKGVPPKTSIIIDGAGRSGVSGKNHDIAWRAFNSTERVLFALFVSGLPTGIAIGRSDVSSATMSLLHAFSLDLLQRQPGHPTPAAQGRSRRTLSRSRHSTIRAVLSHLKCYKVRPSNLPVYRKIYDKLTVGQVSHVVANLPFGVMSADTLRQLSRLSMQYGDGRLRLTPWEAVVIANVKNKRVANLRQQLASLDTVDPTVRKRIEMHACAGGNGCGRTKMNIREDAEVFQSALLSALGQEGSPSKSVVVHISGCERGCAHAGNAAWLAIAREKGTYELYADHSCSDIRAKTAQPTGRPMSIHSIAAFIQGNKLKSTG